MSSPFKIDFNPDDYKHLHPPGGTPPSEEIINFNKDIEDAIWTRQTPPDYLHKGFLDLEVKRIRQGAFINIKGVLLWIPPQMYFFLQYGTVKSINGRYPDFRLKKLKEYYFQEECRRNVDCLGSFIMKNRRDGTTTDTTASILWEMAKGVQGSGQIGMQSRTDSDAFDPCYTTLKAHFNGLPAFIKELFYNDAVNPKNIQTQLRFETTGENGRYIYAKYYPSGNNSMDGKEMIICFLDEVAKWDKNSLLQTFGTYKKFVLEGIIRKGLFKMISSPSEHNGRCNEEAHELWKQSDLNDLQPNGTTKSRIHRYHSNPLHGITGLFDKFGDADPSQVYEHIMRERKNAVKGNELNEIRGFPLNENEMFGCADNSAYWDNHVGIIARKDYIMGSIYKDEVTKELKYIWGNLEWDVLQQKVFFRANEKNEFDIIHGRFCFNELPNWDIELNDITKPPAYVGSVIGVDPYHLGKGTKNAARASNAGAVDWKFRELANENFIPKSTFIYNCRPAHIYTFFDDMIKAAIFTRSYIQYEKTSDGLEIYADEMGYGAWILNSSTHKNSVNKSEIGRGKKGGAFMNDAKAIVNILTNVPVNPDNPYLLEHFWHEELLEQLINFTEDDTHKFDIVMALFQAVTGAVKLSKVKTRVATEARQQMMNYLLS